MKKKSNLILTLVLGATVMFSASCQKESMSPISQAQSPTIELGDDAVMSTKKGSQSIAEIAIDNNFDELVAALSYVDSAEGTTLVNMFLNGTDQYTVFAPTDAAFNNLYSALGVSEITDIDSDVVLDVLLYHVTDGRRSSNSVVPKKKSRSITTLLNESFDVNSDLSIDAIGNSANITAANISASNGIIHVIDTVILPF